MVRRKNIGTSTSEFPLGCAHGQCKRSLLSLCPLSRARLVLQIHWKQENSRTNALNDCVRVFIMTSWAPRGALHYRPENGKGLLCHNLDRESNMVPRAYTLRRSPLRQVLFLTLLLCSITNSTIICRRSYVLCQRNCFHWFYQCH